MTLLLVLITNEIKQIILACDQNKEVFFVFVLFFTRSAILSDSQKTFITVVIIVHIGHKSFMSVDKQAEKEMFKSMDTF